jgi:hypothetical protein
MDVTGSASCPMAGFGVNGVESYGSAARVNEIVDTFKLHICTSGFLSVT